MTASEDCSPERECVSDESDVKQQVRQQRAESIAREGADRLHEALRTGPRTPAGAVDADELQETIDLVRTELEVAAELLEAGG